MAINKVSNQAIQNFIKLEQENKIEDLHIRSDITRKIGFFEKLALLFDKIFSPTYGKDQRDREFDKLRSIERLFTKDNIDKNVDVETLVSLQTKIFPELKGLPIYQNPPYRIRVEKIEAIFKECIYATPKREY